MLLAMQPTTRPQPTTPAMRSSLMLFWSETTKPPGVRYWLIIWVAQTVS